MTAQSQLDELQQQLDEYTVGPASAQLRARLMDAIPHVAPRPWIEVLLDAVGGWRIAAPALAMSLVLGIVVQMQGWLGQAESMAGTELDVLELALLDGAAWEVSHD